MRYQTIPNITFTDKNNTSYTIKAMREIPTDYVLNKKLIVTSKDMLDEIACREDVYEQGS